MRGIVFLDDTSAVLTTIDRVFHVSACVCCICFFVGLIFCTGAGEYWLKMFDSFAGTIGLVMIALLEMVAVMFIYGHEK
jgi:solute carrier family 6 amino acid/orphan transporter-like 15/16/17/18/20